MIGILPGRLVTRQRLAGGTLVVMGASLLNLIAVEFGPLGSPWPVALLWPICGWAGLGPNVTTASLLFGLGLWVDVLTGAPLGTWALVALLTHGVILLLNKFVGVGGLGSLGSAILSALVMAITMILFSLWRGTGFYALGLLLSLATAVGCYGLLGRLFELREDDT